MSDITKVLRRAVLYANRKHPNGGRDALDCAESFINHTEYAKGFFGVEYVECAGRELAYLNSGDTYSATIAYETVEGEASAVCVTCWGDWYEGVEREHCESEGVIRCGNCGEFTPCADEWRDTVCDSCGRNVATGEAPTVAVAVAD